MSDTPRRNIGAEIIQGLEELKARMSATPRTDAAQDARAEQKTAFPDPVVVECAKLERELAEAKDQNEKLRHDLMKAISNHSADLTIHGPERRFARGGGGSSN